MDSFDEDKKEILFEPEPNDSDFEEILIRSSPSHEIIGMARHVHPEFLFVRVFELAFPQSSGFVCCLALIGEPQFWLEPLIFDLAMTCLGPNFKLNVLNFSSSQIKGFRSNLTDYFNVCFVQVL